MVTVTMPKQESMTLVIEAPALRLRKPKQRSQAFADRRTKRQRTRSQQKRNAMREW